LPGGHLDQHRIAQSLEIVEQANPRECIAQPRDDLAESRRGDHQVANPPRDHRPDRPGIEPERPKPDIEQDGERHGGQQEQPGRAGR
jgi:hypothetical protein